MSHVLVLRSSCTVPSNDVVIYYEVYADDTTVHVYRTYKSKRKVSYTQVLCSENKKKCKNSVFKGIALNRVKKYIYENRSHVSREAHTAFRRAAVVSARDMMAVSCAPAFTIASARAADVEFYRGGRATSTLMARMRRPSRSATTVNPSISICITSASYEPTDRVSELQSEGAYAVLAAAQALECQGRDIVHLEIGQPGFPSPPHVVEAGIDAIKGGQTKCVHPSAAVHITFNPPPPLPPRRLLPRPKKKTKN